MVGIEQLKQLDQKIKKVKEQKASVLAQLENLAKQKLPRKVKKAKREPLQKEWQRLWNELKSLYAEKKELLAKSKRTKEAKQVPVIKPKRSKEDQEKVKELKSRKKGILKEIEKVKKDASLSKEEKKAKSKELREKWQSLMDEINDLVKGKKPVEKPVSKKELAIKHLKKANIRQDPRFIKIVEDVLKETKDKTPGEIRDLMRREVDESEDLKRAIEQWGISSYEGEFLGVWQEIQQEKSEIFDKEGYANRWDAGEFIWGKSKFKESLVKLNALTAQYYKKQGKDKLTVYRGVQDTKRYYKDMKPGEKKPLQANPLSSWSENKEIASQFGDVILKMSFPVERILITANVLGGERYFRTDESEAIIDVRNAIISTDNLLV